MQRRRYKFVTILRNWGSNAGFLRCEPLKRSDEVGRTASQADKGAA